jgi:hypothetical protein
MQCCGDPFEVGSVVEWTVAPVDTEFLGVVLGSAEAERVTDAEEHHSESEHALATLSGEVRSIASVHCAYEPSPEGDALYPVADSARLEAKQRVDGWERETDDLKFLGYLVDLAES